MCLGNKNIAVITMRKLCLFRMVHESLLPKFRFDVSQN